MGVGIVEMSAQAELLLREIIARGKKIEDYHSYEIERRKHVKSLPLHLRLEANEWKLAA